MRIQDIHFPIIAISGTAASVFPTAAYLDVVGKGALKSGYLDNLWIVDASARSGRVQSYEVVDEPFWRRPKTPFGRGVRVKDIVFQDLGTVSIEEVRTRVAHCVRSEEEVWDDVGDPRTIEAAIMNAGTVLDVMKAMFPGVHFDEALRKSQGS